MKTNKKNFRTNIVAGLAIIMFLAAMFLVYSGHATLSEAGSFLGVAAFPLLAASGLLSADAQDVKDLHDNTYNDGK